MAVAGLVFALAWWWLLQSYRRLNWAKFEVIKASSRDCPFSSSRRVAALQTTKAPRRLGRRRRCGRGCAAITSSARSERVVPLAFAGIYIAELIRQATG